MSDQGLSERIPLVLPAPNREPAPPSTAAQPEVDWQKRYADLQPEYTRASQENAELGASRSCMTC
jgi:hypothetical protein